MYIYNYSYHPLQTLPKTSTSQKPFPEKLPKRQAKQVQRKGGRNSVSFRALQKRIMKTHPWLVVSNPSEKKKSTWIISPKGKNIK